MDELTTENSTLRNELKRLQESCKALNADNSSLADTLGDLKGGDDPSIKGGGGGGGRGEDKAAESGGEGGDEGEGTGKQAETGRAAHSLVPTPSTLRKLGFQR